MKHPFSALAELFAAKIELRSIAQRSQTELRSVHNTEEEAGHRAEKSQTDMSYQEALRSFAYPLGSYLSGELEDAEELFGYLRAGEVVSEEAICLLKGDSEFVRMFEKGLSAGKEDEGYDETYDEEEYEYNMEEESNPLCL